MSSKQQEIFIVGYGRTPIGCLNGQLSKKTATSLMADCISGTFAKCQLTHIKQHCDQLIVGCVLQTGCGQAMANAIAHAAKLPAGTNAMLVNKVCASGMKAIHCGVESIACGTSEFVVAGGVESMSNVPHFLPGSRSGMRFGNMQLIDAIAHDGLTDFACGLSMGAVTEKLAAAHGINRDTQDAAAIESYERAIAAAKNGHTAAEIVAIEVTSPTDKSTLLKIDADEEPRNERVATCKPAFAPDGTITAASSSKIADGAAVVLLASADFCRRNGVTPIAKILSFADATLAPMDFGVAPAEAAKKCLARAQISAAQVDVWELNEAFSVVPCVNAKLLGIDATKCNIFGGAAALGHPLGCSGARIVCTLLNAMRHRDAAIGLAAVCHGGGGASALLVEKCASVELRE